MLKQTVKLGEGIGAGYQARVGLEEAIVLGRAHVRVRHSRPRDWIRNPRTGLLEPDPRAGLELLSEDEAWNLITNAGRIQLHKQGYDTAGLATNGFNYIALSNDAVTETASSTTLSNEIAANGLGRAQGTVTLPTGTGNVTTIDKTFTNTTSNQAAQKAALFNASSAGTMNHVLAFTQRSLVVGDTLQITYSITLG
jgi:hypothetical protein